MADIRITLDRTPRVVAAGTTAGEILAEAGVPGIAVRVNNQHLRDLTWVPEDGDQLESIPIDSEEGRAIMRHSCAHVLAQAVQDLFPEAKLGIGPPIENGFYYDFDVDRPFTPEDLKAIERKMQEIIKAGQRFSRRVVSEEEARAELKDEPYKLELIELKGSAAEEAEGASVEVGGGELTIYDNLDAKTGELCWKDLCRGPHLPTTRHIPAFKLMRTAAAYWRGSEKNPQLQRIYGTAWESKDKLKEYLDFLAEAEKRDHRRLGAELDLFSFPEEIGSGLPVFHPKGGTIRRVMEDYSRRRHEEAGYAFVNTPHITKENLYQISGHLNWFAEGMYPPMELEGSRYYLKPMNCPMHILIYRARGRSYKELPLRLFEFGTVYRYEKSGVVHGLTRVRGLTQDDAHIFCTREQMADELHKLLVFVLDLLRDYGLQEFYLELSTKPEGKAVGTDEEWAEATEALRSVAEKMGLDLVLDEGGGAFYGPKISVQAKDAIGRTWQLSTIQLDFQLPQRFDLEYQAADGSRQRPIMIHRALFGSIERFFGVLLEHYAGAFPPWLAPVQVVCIPITDEQVPYLQQVAVKLRERGIRVEVDASDDRMQKKIRNAQKQKVPYMLLAGRDDVARDAVSFRYRTGEQKNFVPIDEAVEEIVKAVEDRVQI
ncbi:threonine--tRNA ligase [Carbonactinospora thermoautotrophica]|uniref:Threonine--tRNA ligase n=1 Tax=Carbonactinospora thermoautotrophica TaxID=1469144 RepID=A0A132NBX9_9ACTN|nr:threonine--tRNA ligase [Carbonactinospora thermoautotrophica]KWX00645.1 Threonine--tRNA ligase [Carbonactinospora thermoautotrophica]KWX05356.1 threonine--tRNA ligase [Carbonactinospora thermoautotrophica]KWX07467.1 threonine--tRNA ligase [Carbonactinospora thermoautotrophica]